MVLKKIRDLNIAKNQFDFSKDIIAPLDYLKWVKYIEERQNYFTWEENTARGIFLKENIDKVPEKFRENTLFGLNKISCSAEYNLKKKYYDIAVTFHRKLKRISISFERKVKIEDLKLFLDMANYLDALLLNHGNEIIDEKVIESWE